MILCKTFLFSFFLNFRPENIWRAVALNRGGLNRICPANMLDTYQIRLVQLTDRRYVLYTELGTLIPLRSSLYT